jgi:hypothetical protein
MDDSLKSTGQIISLNAIMALLLVERRPCATRSGWPTSTRDENANGAVVQSTFSNAPEQQSTNAACPSCSDHEQLCTCGVHGRKKIAQRFAVSKDRTRAPSAAVQFGRGAIELLGGRSRSHGIQPHDFTRNLRGAWKTPLRWNRHQLDHADQCHVPIAWRRQPGDECQSAASGGRTVEADDDPAYALGLSDDKDGAPGATDDTSGCASHEHSTNDPMSAPTNYDRIGLKALRFAENAFHR